MPQANSTACGRAERPGPATSLVLRFRSSPHLAASSMRTSETVCSNRCRNFKFSALALPVQHADQREQAARGVEVDLDLLLQPLAQQLGAFVVKPAPSHVDRLDLRRRGGA